MTLRTNSGVGLPLLCTVLLAVYLLPPAAGQQYTVTDLGVLYPNWQLLTDGVDDEGHVAGAAQDSTFSQYRAVRYSDGVLTDLGTLGGDLSEALAISTNGLIAGDATTTSDPLSYHAFLWDGEMHDLGTLPFGDTSQAWGVNQNGVVVGWGVTLVGSGYFLHPFKWENGVLVDLSPGFPADIRAQGINDAGVIVGTYDPGGDSAAALWDEGGLHFLDDLAEPFDGSLLTASAINAGGQVAGEAHFNGLGFHAYRYTDGTVEHIGPASASVQLRAWALNDAGYVVGDYAPGPEAYFTAYVWPGGGDIVDLNTRISPALDVVLIHATGINARGDISCTGHEQGDPLTFRGYLLRPYAPGDLNCDGVVNAFDIDPFVLSLTDPLAYAAQLPGCNGLNADINFDGEVNAFDIDPFVELLTGG